MTANSTTKPRPERQDLAGPLQGVPAWAFESAMPQHWVERIVSLCLERHAETVFALRLENRALDEDELIAVGLAMRDGHLLAHVGHDIRSAWIAVPWPEGIARIRREVCWQVSEHERVAKNRSAGISDLFDVYDPSRLSYRSRMPMCNARESRRDGHNDDDYDDDCRASAAYGALQRQIADARKARDDQERAKLIAIFTGGGVAQDA